MGSLITPTFSIYQKLITEARDNTGFAIDIDLQDMSITMVNAAHMQFLAASAVHDADVWDALLTAIRAANWRYVRCWLLDGLHIYGIYVS